MKTKVCSICNKEKSFIEFYNNARVKDGKFPYCKTCSKIKQQKYKKENRERTNATQRAWSRTPSGIFYNLRIGAKKRKIDFNISREDFVEWHLKQERKCCYCEIKEDRLPGWVPKFYFRLTIDRLNTSRPYEIDNIALCCYRCNRLKGSFFNEEEMKQIAMRYMKPKWTNIGRRYNPEWPCRKCGVKTRAIYKEGPLVYALCDVCYDFAYAIDSLSEPPFPQEVCYPQEKKKS